MRRIGMVLVAFVVLLVGCGGGSTVSDTNAKGDCSADMAGGNTFTDCRDKQTYHIVEFAGSVWFLENLNYEIPSGNTWCYGNLAKNCAVYGRLYDWDAAKAACPSGWHLSDSTEWSVALETGTAVTSLSMQAGGRFFMNGFTYNGEMGFFWTSTPKNADANYSILLNDILSIQGQYGRSPGFSVRCVMD